jgi:hypothetical protein
MNEQRLIDIIDAFRGKLSEEQLRLADCIADCKKLNRDLEAKENKIIELEKELEGYRVPSETQTVGTDRTYLEVPN